MKLRLPSEFLYQVFALLFAVIVVHAPTLASFAPAQTHSLRFRQRNRPRAKPLLVTVRWRS